MVYHRKVVNLMLNKIIGLLVTIFIIFSIVLSCASPTPTGHDALLQNERLWQSWNIQSYSFHLEVGRFRPPPSADVLITVINGVSTGFEVVKSYGSDPANIVEKYDTIDKLFEVLKQSYLDKESTTGVEYDPIYGFPTFIDAWNIKEPLDIHFAVYALDFEPATDSSSTP
jgi:hypothetical protein